MREKTFLESALGRTFGISEMIVLSYYITFYSNLTVNCKAKTNPNVVITDIEFQDTLATDKAVFYSDSGMCSSNT